MSFAVFAECRSSGRERRCRQRSRLAGGYVRARRSRSVSAHARWVLR